MTQNTKKWIWCLSWFLLAGTCPLSGQVNQQSLVQSLQGDDLEARHLAVLAALEMDPGQVNPRLHAALSKALEESIRLRDQTLSEGESFEALHGHYHLDLVMAVANQRDPDDRPLLVASLGYGAAVIRALTSLGEPVIEGVVEVVSSQTSPDAAVDNGLSVLANIYVNAPDGAGVSTRHPAVREAAFQRLTGAQDPAVLMAAIDLAMAIGDEELVDMVRALATDPHELSIRGIHDQWTVNHVQEHALALLEKVWDRPNPLSGSGDNHAREMAGAGASPSAPSFRPRNTSLSGRFCSAAFDKGLCKPRTNGVEHCDLGIVGS